MQQRFLLGLLFLLPLLVLPIPFAILVGVLSWYLVPLCQNIQQAKRSGLHYIVVPFHTYNFVWVKFVGRPLLRQYDKYALPSLSITSRRQFLDSLWPLKLRHAPFAEFGTDTFMIVSPGGIIVNTADADVIHEILYRPTDFPKAIQLYKSIAIYGQNVVSSGGAMWRRHHKLTSPTFSDRNNRLVWITTLERTSAMLKSWTVKRNDSKRTVQQFKDDAMQLSLEVIGTVGLGQDIKWGEEQSDFAGKSLPKGYTMTFAASLKHVCENITSIAMFKSTPSLIRMFNLRKQSNQKHYEAFMNWGHYMKEMITTKKLSIDASSQSPIVDIFTQLLKGQQEGAIDDEKPLTDKELIGNLFLFIIAGHETSASSIHLSILLLALHPAAQKMVQRDLDQILNGRSVSEWDFNRDLPRLLNGRLGAVLNEQLRLQSPTPSIPKLVTTIAQEIMVEGKRAILPANAIIRICGLGVHVNPRFWPHGATKDRSKPAFEHNNPNNDLEEFKPERWATAYSLNGYVPHPGAFLPFSLGQRSCLGQRFAKIEIMAVLAVIFSQYSIELDLSGLVCDHDLRSMSREEKYKIWKEAEEKAQKEWRTNVTCLMTVQLTRNANIPLRVVKRGEEFCFDLE